MKHKNFDSLSSFSIGREEQDEDLVRETTSVLTLSDERVGLGGYDVDLTTLTSLSKGRVGSTTDKSESTAWSTSGGSRDKLQSLVGITC